VSAENPDTATRVHKLAVPHQVTMHAEPRPDAIGPGHHYLVTGVDRNGEEAFPEQVVGSSAAGSAAEALWVQLRRFRDRGW
jgi:hypothetical protein